MESGDDQSQILRFRLFFSSFPKLSEEFTVLKLHTCVATLRQDFACFISVLQAL